MPSKFSMFLIASLAVNAALLGVVGGQLVNRQRQPSVEETQMNRPSPPPSDVMAAWAQLPEVDRAELRKQLRDRWVSLEDDRKRLADAGMAVHDAAMTEPYDEARVRDALTIYQQRQERMRQSAEDIFISHFSKMPPQARATAAVGLLTPFNQRVERSGSSKGRDGKGDGKRDEARGDGKPGGPLENSGPRPSPTSTNRTPEKTPVAPN